MSWPRKDSSSPNLASTSQEVLRQDVASSSSSRMLRVTLLADEWGSSKGGLSTINRELAKQLAKHPNVEVTFFVPKCSEVDKKDAVNLGITVIEAKERPGFEPVDWLISPPSDLSIDVVIGHGVKLGRQAQFIRESHHCKWVQVVHIAPEELAMYKGYSEAISRGGEKHQAEIQLCEKADFVVAVGPKLADDFSAYLRSCKKEVFDLTPSIFNEFAYLEQAPQEGKTFRLLVFGRGDTEDFELKGYDIAAQAVAELKDPTYHLIFVGAPNGKEEEVKENLIKHGISRSQLTVRSFDESREKLANLFCEADLAIMPSRTEGFGLTALEALSAGLPILVSGNSGFGEALRKVPYGSCCILDSEDAKVWANGMNQVRRKDREMRLKECLALRTGYAEQYNWQTQCKELVVKLLNMTHDLSGKEFDFKGKGKRLSSSTDMDQTLKRPKLTTGTEKVFQDLQKPRVDAYQISNEVDLLNNLRQNAWSYGFIISNNDGGGDCMFYALAEQLWLVKGISISHGELRRRLVAFLQSNPKLASGTDLYSFVADYSSWSDYLKDMGKDGNWGDHVVLVAAANCFQVPIRIISSLPNHRNITIDPEPPVDNTSPLVLGHVHELHYVSLRPVQGHQSGDHLPSSAGTASHQLNGFQRGEHVSSPSGTESQPHNAGFQRGEHVSSPSGTASQPHNAGFQRGEHVSSPSGTASHAHNAGFQRGEHVSSPSETDSQPHNAEAQTGSEHLASPARTLCPPFYELRKLLSCIKDEYTRRARLQPVPWCDVLLSFERVYTRLAVKVRKMQSPVLTDQEVKMYDMFFSHENCKTPRSVLVEGDPGIGKSTFCLKMANDWATGAIPTDCSFPQVELVVLLKCRDIDGDVWKAFEEQLFPKDVEDQEKSDFLKYIQLNQEKLLVILDGLDELPEHARQDVNNVLLRKIIPNCFLVVTARQERGIHVRKEFNTLLEIKGFAKSDAFDYISRHFQDKGEESLGSDLIEEIKLDRGDCLSKLLENPLNTALLCLVFEDQGTLPSTRTELYKSIIFCILKRFCTKNSIPFDDSTLIEQFKDTLVSLGKLALDCLKEDRLYFSERKLNSSTQQVPQMGFVSKEAGTKMIKPEHYYAFPHKTFQEFFAALHLAHLVKQEVDTKDLYEFVSSIHDLTGRYEQVFMFVAGILGEDGRHHFELLGQLMTQKKNGSKHPWKFLCDSFKESGHIEEMAAAIVPFMSISDLVVSDGDADLDVYSYSHVQHECQCEDEDLYNDPECIVDVDDGLLVVGGVVLPSGLGKFLSENKSLESLSLNMSKCHQSDVALASLGEGLPEHRSLTLLTLTMCKCDLSDDGLASFSKGLSENTSLTSFSLDMTGSDGSSEDKSLSSPTLQGSRCNVVDAGLVSLGKGLSENKSLTSLTLDISRCDLVDDFLAALGGGLSENKSLTSLSLRLSDCDVEHAALASLGGGLSENKSLTTLTINISGCDLVDAFLASLGGGLSENKSLTSLSLRLIGCDVGHAALASLGGGLLENTSLTSLTLNLSFCRVVDGDNNLSALMTMYTSWCKGLSKNKSLTSLTLSMPDCNLTDTAQAASAQGLLGNTMLTSLILRMFGCNLGDAALASLGGGLAENTTLTSLSLSLYTCNLSDAALASFGKGLSENRSLTSLTLTMDKCYLSDDGLAFFGRGLSENRSLTSLTLSLYSCYMSNGGLAFFGRGLSENKSLTSLTLSLCSCYMSDAGLALLCKGLLENTSLTCLSLYISECCPSDATLTSFGKGLSKNVSLTSLTLEMIGCDLDNAALAFLGEGLSENTALTSLKLNMNSCYLTDVALASLGDGLSKNKSLTSLSLDMYECRLTDVALASLGEGLSKNKSLTSLTLDMLDCNSSFAALSSLDKGLQENNSLTSLSLWIVLHDIFESCSGNTRLTLLSVDQCRYDPAQIFVRQPCNCQQSCEHNNVWTPSNDSSSNDSS